MNVEVRLFAGLRKGRFRREVLDLPEPATIRSLLAGIDVPAEHVAMPLVNGRYCDLDQPLGPEDVVSLFPPVAGG